MAKQKYSPNEIQSKTEDWGMDVNDTDKRPFSGASVQKYIKQAFDGKIGLLHYDTSNNRYIAFADAESRDLYLEDPTRTDLILGTFDAPFNFTASISLISSQNNVLLKGSSGHYIEYTFDITDKNGASTMESVNVKYTFISGGLKKTVSAQYSYGTKVHFLADEYLGDGETVVQIAIVGQDTLAATTRSVSYRVLDLTLSSSYNIGTVNDVKENQYIQIPFYVKSSRHVVLKASIDYETFETVMETDTYETNGAHQIDTLNLSEGKHNVRFMAQNVIDGVTYSSDIVYKDFIVSRGTIADNLVLFEGTIPMGTEDTQFKLYGMKKYIPYSVTIAAYNPSSSQSNITVSLVSAGQEYAIGQKVLSNGSAETVTFTPVVSGAATLKVVNGETTEEVSTNIEMSSVQVEEITNQLELALRAMGRSNSDENRDSWTYGKYSTVFSGFGWSARSGWVNNVLKINAGAAIDIDIAPLSFNPEGTGFTFEMDFSTELVNDEDAVVMDLTENGKGLKITASEASLTSGNGRTVSTRFRPGDNLRVAFVVDNSLIRNSKLAYIYIDGVPSGAIDFMSSDTFSVSKQMKIGGTDGAVVNISDIRIYRRALTAQEIRNNYILYQNTMEDMLSVYNRNDIMTDGKIDYMKLANQLPVMIVTGDIPVLENTTNKKEAINVNVKYINLQNPELSFNMINARMTPQGTSSMYYPKKNFRLYTQKNENTELRTGSYELGEGTLVENKLYAFKEGAQPVNTWCFKADYAESSSTHNTGVARLWNDALTNMQVTVDGTPQYVGRTKAQQAAIDNGYEYDVRTTIDGFPIVMFYHQTEDDPLIFMGKYNFNNDKSTESVFGFKNIPGFDSSKVECWEQLDSGNPYGLFSGDPEGFDENWDKAFEGRYPDSNQDTTNLKAFYTWVYSCKGNQEKFNSEWKQHIDPYKLAAYYVYLIRFGGVDQVVKNAMLTTEDGLIWFFINYDNDTILGEDNDGIVSFYWDITRQTKIKGTDVYCYAGHDSVLWNLLEGCEEFMNLVPVVDQALYSARKGTKDVGLSYDNVIDMFNNKQSAQWCETIYSEDAKYKYIDPYKNNSVNQLAKLQGRRSSHRSWWVQNRWNLFDGKWMTGEFRKEGITFKCQQGDAGTTLKVTAGNEMYYGIKVQTTMIQSQSLKAGESYDFAIDRQLQIGTPVSISNPANIAGLDISNFAANLSSLDIQKVKNGAGESRLKKLIIGKEDVENNFLTTISGLENAYALNEINITGFKQITSLDLSGQTEMREVIAPQSGLREVSLPEGAPIRLLELPETIQSLNLVKLPELTRSYMRIEGWDNLGTLRITDCPNLSRSIDVPVSWLNSKTTEDIDCTLYIDNIVWANVEPSLFLKICTAKINGANVTLKGQVKLTSASQEIIDTITKAFGSEVFTPTNELYINAPDSVFLSGPSTVVEGDTAQYTATVFSDYRGTVTFSLINNSRSGVRIDADTGLLTTTENGSSNSTLTVRATHIPTQGVAVYTDKEVTIKRRIYPSKVTINGNANLNVELNKFSWSCSDSGVTGEVRTEWELSGDITGYAEMYSQSDNTCVVKKTLDSIETIEGTLTAKLYSVTTGALKKTVTKSITVLNPDIIMTKVSNPEVMAIMYANGLCENESYMTKTEAASVADIQFNTGTTAKTSIFYNKGIKCFDELEYFTGLTSIPSYCFYGCSLTSIKFPPNIISIGNGAFAAGTTYGSYFEEFNIPEGVADIGESLFVDNSYYFDSLMPDGFQMRLSLPSTLKTIRDKAFCYVPIVSISGFSEGLTSIGKYAFNKYVGTVLSLPNSLTTLGEYAFEGLDLTEFTVPDGVTEITPCCIGGKDCVMYIHAGVTKITYKQFMIKEIVVDSGNTTFKNYNGIVVDSSNYAVNVPAYLDAEEFSLDGISGFRKGSFYDDGIYETCCVYLMNVKKLIIGGTWKKALFENSFIGMPSLEEIDLSGNTNFILKDGHLFSADGTTLCKLVKADSYTIPEEVTTIYGQKYGNVNDLVVPDNGLSLRYTFKYYRGNKITIKGTHILYDTFRYTDGLRVVDLSECINNGNIGNLFYNSSVEEVILGKDFVFNWDHIFGTSSRLRTITFPEGITQPSLFRSFFDNLEYLEYVDIPSNFTGMPYFDGCVNLKTIICRIVTAPSTSSEDSFGVKSGKYTGMNTKDTGENVFYVPAGATGYDTGEYAATLFNPDRCGFTLSATL